MQWLTQLRARLDQIGAYLVLLAPMSSTIAEEEWFSAGADLVSRLPVNPTVLAADLKSLSDKTNRRSDGGAPPHNAQTVTPDETSILNGATQESAAQEPTPQAPVQAVLADLPRVLLVEDNLINQEVALFLLEELGVRADLAENGEEALERLLAAADDAYQLIFMDCQMPKMDGYEATRRIRKDGSLEAYHNCPIIAMTANAMKGDKEHCLETGMSDYMTKPVDPDELSRKLKKWL